MKSRLLAPLAVLALFAGLPALSPAQSLSASSSSRLLDFFPSNPDPNSLSTFTFSGNNQRGLLFFDLTGQPSGPVANATLRLNGRPFQGGTSTTTVNANPLTRALVSSQATWLSASSGNPWTTAGGDFNNALNASVTFAQGPGWIELNVTNIVNAWLTGAQTNHGFILRGVNGNEMVFHSHTGSIVSGATNVALAPQLNLTPIPEPMTMAVLALGAVAALRKKRKA